MMECGRWSILCLLLVSCAFSAQQPHAAAPAAAIGGCPVLPDDNIWNTPIMSLPVDRNSATYVQSIGSDVELHADFGSGLWDGGPIGIPYVTVGAAQPKVPISFRWDDESDPGPYPIPPNVP